jgi:hypothetical protein
MDSCCDKCGNPISALKLHSHRLKCKGKTQGSRPGPKTHITTTGAVTRLQEALTYYAEAEDRAIEEMGIATEAIKAREGRQKDALSPKKARK